MRVHTAILVFSATLLALTTSAYPLATEHVGPSTGHEQPGIDDPIVDILKHPSRVYSIWVNGNENFYFDGNPDEVNELLESFAKADMSEYDVWIRDVDAGFDTLQDCNEHEVLIESGRGSTRGFRDTDYQYNVRLHLPSGIYLHVAKAEPQRQLAVRPRLFLRLDHTNLRWDQLKLPPNVVLRDGNGGKQIGLRHSTSVRPFKLETVQNVNLFYPIATEDTPNLTYPVAVQTATFAKTGDDIRCAFKATEDISSRARIAATVELIGKGPIAAKTVRLSGKGDYELDFPQAAVTDPNRFKVSLQRTQRWGRTVEHLQLRLQPDKYVFTDKQTVSLSLDVRNKADKLVKFGSHESTFTLIVDGLHHRWDNKWIDIDMAAAHLTGDNKQVTIPISFDKGDYFTTAGDELTLTPGPHNIQALFLYGKGDIRHQITSNVVRIQIRKQVPTRRRLYYCNIKFDEGDPGTARNTGVATRIVRWDKGSDKGKSIAVAGETGLCIIPIADEDLPRFQSGQSSLTVCISKTPWQLGDADSDRIPFDELNVDRSLAPTVSIGGPKKYYGRILFDDGTPAYLDPMPWPGATIDMDFMAGQEEVDQQGYFWIAYTDEEYADAVANDRKYGAYVPNKDRGSRTSRAKFPAKLLSKDKSKAGAIKIHKPIYDLDVSIDPGPAMAGKPLPKFDGIEIDFQPGGRRIRTLLICFWDVNQRSSRHMVTQLVNRADELKEKRIELILIQAAATNTDTLNQWLTANAPNLKAGRIVGDFEKKRHEWSIQALPWLIMTSPRLMIKAEGFNLEDLDHARTKATVQ